jgi:hypothetical protein
MQLSLGTAPEPGSDALPLPNDIVIPAVEVFDTKEEQLSSLVMGGYVVHQDEEHNAAIRKQTEFSARAIEMKHHKGVRFLLLVESHCEQRHSTKRG